MSELKLINVLLSSILFMTIVMFLWTFSYINKVQSSNILNNAPVVSAFNA